jgi:hypothetical protein
MWFIRFLSTPNYSQITLIRDLEEQSYLRPQSDLKGEPP